MNGNVVLLYSSQETFFSKKSRGRVGLVRILAYGKVVKKLEERAYLLFKVEFPISK